MSAERVEKQITTERPCSFNKVIHGNKKVEGDEAVSGTLEGVQAAEKKVLSEKANRENQFTDQQEQAEGEESWVKAYLEIGSKVRRRFW